VTDPAFCRGGAEAVFTKGSGEGLGNIGLKNCGRWQKVDCAQRRKKRKAKKKVIAKIPEGEIKNRTHFRGESLVSLFWGERGKPKKGREWKKLHLN